LNSEIKTNNAKGYELEAANNEQRVLLVAYVPNIHKSTKAAKEELLVRTEKVLRKQFGYTQFYLAFYGYDTNLYAMKAGDYTRVAHHNIEPEEEERLHGFYGE
jgi:hypothetical protein